MAMTNFGSGIWLYRRRTRLAILKLTVPATIIRSAWRGVARNAPAPKRSMSYREAPVAIISMAQQASPNVIGHMLDSRAQLIACSSDVVMTLSSKRPSRNPICDAPAGRERAGTWVKNLLRSCANQLFGLRLLGCGADGCLRLLGSCAAHPIQIATLPQIRE